MQSIASNTDGRNSNDNRIDSRRSTAFEIHSRTSIAKEQSDTRHVALPRALQPASDDCGESKEDGPNFADSTTSSSCLSDIRSENLAGLKLTRNFLNTQAAGAFDPRTNNSVDLLTNGEMRFVRSEGNFDCAPEDATRVIAFPESSATKNEAAALTRLSSENEEVDSELETDSSKRWLQDRIAKDSAVVIPMESTTSEKEDASITGTIFRLMLVIYGCGPMLLMYLKISLCK